jgi:hypothetical protein
MLPGHTFLPMFFLIFIIMMSFLHSAYIYIACVSIKQLNRINGLLSIQRWYAAVTDAAYIKSMVVNVKLVETKCATCGSPIYVYEDFVREKMYCTLHCMMSSGSEAVSRERLEVLAG